MTYMYMYILQHHPPPPPPYSFYGRTDLILLSLVTMELAGEVTFYGMVRVNSHGEGR